MRMLAPQSGQRPDWPELHADRGRNFFLTGRPDSALAEMRAALEELRVRDNLEAELATDALQMALWRRRPEPGLVHHSDRGVRYACRAYRELLDAHRVRASVSKKGDCWDDRRSGVASHGVTESFFATLEWELIEGSDGHTHAEARRDLFDYIEVWYNRQRRHSTLGYLSPAEYEDRLALKRRAA